MADFLGEPAVIGVALAVFVVIFAAALSGPRLGRASGKGDGAFPYAADAGSHGDCGGGDGGGGCGGD